MINFTLTITAAPELLAVLSNFTSAITSAKVVTIPDHNSDCSYLRPVQNGEASQTTYPMTNSIPQQINTVQPQVQVQNPAGTVPVYSQSAASPASSGQAPVQSVQAAPVQNSIVPTSTQSYTMEQLAVAATQIVDSGRRTELVALLNSFGVQALTAMPKEQYGAFATQLRTFGAKI